MSSPSIKSAHNNASGAAHNTKKKQINSPSHFTAALAPCGGCKGETGTFYDRSCPDGNIDIVHVSVQPQQIGWLMTPYKNHTTQLLKKSYQKYTIIMLFK